jgi:asparagine synthase (glutamine-hydrolysing)
MAVPPDPVIIPAVPAPARAAAPAPRRDELAGYAGRPVAPTGARSVLAQLGAAPAGAGCEHAGAALAAAGPSVAFAHADGAALVLVGRPRWETSGATAGADVPARVLEALRGEGPRALTRLRGAFALVMITEAGHRALLAVDRMGVANLVYSAAQPGLAFATRADLLDDCLAGARVIDLQSVFNYLFLHFVPGPATIFEGQRRIPPGGYVQLADGRVETGCYWKPRFDESAARDGSGLQGEFRSLLERAVRARLDGRAAGAFLSGGTDSSTIAGMIGRAEGTPARTYSIGFEAEGYDEIAYARVAARHFGTDHHEYYVTPADVLALAPRVAAFCDQPFGNASAVPSYYCAQLARDDGVALMLGGDGGDELFGGNERYATQALFSWYARIPRALRRGVIEPFLERVPRAESVPLVRRARGYVKQASMTPPERLHAYNLLRRNPPQSVLCPGFLARVDPGDPLRLLASVHDGADAHSPLNRMLALDWQFTLADNDLYKVGRMCELAGVDVAYPMLDDELVAFSLRLPARLKVRGRRLRPFFKEALRDFLPREVIAKRKHGFGLPVGIWMQTHAPLRDLVYDAVRALGRRGIVLPAFAERVMAEHRSGHAAYWGGELWVMSQLELWLQQHAATPGRALP